MAKEYAVNREGPQPVLLWRSKTGLETPLQGRFMRENTRLIIAPPRWYDVLVVSCVGFGAFLFLGDLGLAHLGIFEQTEHVFTFIGLSVIGAGVWAAFSNERMTIDVRGRTYARLEGQFVGKRLTRGSLNELQGVVLMSQELTFGIIGARQVIYRLVVYWKGSKEPPLVIARDERSLPVGVPINAAAGQIAQWGQVVSKSMGVPFYDYSYQNSAGPLAAI